MYVTLSETLEGVTEIRTVFSNVQHGVADTHNVVEDIQTLVSNIFGMLKSREEADDQRQWVSNTHSASVVKFMLTVAQEPSQVSKVGH